MRRRRRPTLHHAVKDKRVTVLGPVKQPEMDFMSHRGTIKGRAMPACTTRRGGVHGAPAHGLAGDAAGGAGGGGLEPLRFTTRRGLGWTSAEGRGQTDRYTTSATTSTNPQCANRWAPRHAATTPQGTGRGGRRNAAA